MRGFFIYVYVAGPDTTMGNELSRQTAPDDEPESPLITFIESMAGSQGYFNGASLSLLEYGTEVELMLPVRYPRNNSYLELCFVRGVIGLWHVRGDCAIAPSKIEALGKRSPNEYAPAVLVNPKVELTETPGRLYLFNLPDLTFWRYATESPLSRPKILPYKAD